MANPQSTDQALQTAVLALQGQRPADAERIAAEVLKGDPGHVAASGILGYAMMLQNRAAEAVAVLEPVARLSGDPKIETQFADALVATGRRDEALAQLRQTVMRRPAFMPSFIMYARYLAAAGRHPEAVAALEQGVTQFPGAGELQNELALLHIKTNNRGAAHAVLSRALAAVAHPVFLSTQGQLLYLEGDYAAAATAYRSALALNPGDAATRQNLGSSLLEMGQREAGEADIRAAVRAAPQLTGHAIAALSESSHGRMFLRPSAALAFLRGGKA